MYCLKRSITYIDGSTDNIDSVYNDFNEVQQVLHGSLVSHHKQVIELVIKLENVNKEK